MTILECPLFAATPQDIQRERIVITYAVNLISASTLDDDMWQLTWGAEKLVGMNSKILKSMTIEYAKKLDKAFFSRASGPCALMVDGGKDISKNKLLGACLRANGTAQFQNTELDTLDTTWLVFPYPHVPLSH